MIRGTPIDISMFHFDPAMYGQAKPDPNSIDNDPALLGAAQAFIRQAAIDQASMLTHSFSPNLHSGMPAFGHGHPVANNNSFPRGRFPHRLNRVHAEQRVMGRQDARPQHAMHVQNISPARSPPRTPSPRRPASRSLERSRSFSPARSERGDMDYEPGPSLLQRMDANPMGPTNYD